MCRGRAEAPPCIRAATLPTGVRTDRARSVFLRGEGMTIARNRRLAIAALLGAGAVAALAAHGSTPAAHASSALLTAAPSCATPGSDVRVNATGFAPRMTLALKLNGSPASSIDPTNTDAAGNASFRIVARPDLGAATILASDGTNSATANFDVTKFGAFYRPLQGRPHRAVRVTLAGWGAGRTVYLHYVRAGDVRARKTVRVATVGGACGSGSARLAHLYPFNPGRGSWRLQFDTSRGYSSHTRPQFTYLSRIG
jgi:hypothetical protein